MYASIVATTVLQLKEIPARPAEFDGALALFDLAPNVDESAIRSAFADFGEILRCEIDHTQVTVVRFGSHDAALRAKRAAAQLTHICAGIDTLYNDRSYDGRTGEEGLEDDHGRGW